MKSRLFDKPFYPILWLMSLLVQGTGLLAADPAAFTWIDKISAFADKHRPYQLRFDYEIRFREHEPAIGSSTLITVKDDFHQHAVSRNLRRDNPLEEETSQILVVDEDWFWTENHPPQGEPSVFKESMAVIRRSKREAPNLPGSLVKSLAWHIWHLDPNYRGIHHGKVLFEQKLSVEQLAVLGLNYTPSGRPVHLRLEMDAEDIFPVTLSVTLGSGPDSLRILYYHYDAFKQLAEVDDDLFTYTPPAGVQIYPLRPFLPTPGSGERGVLPPAH